MAADSNRAQAYRTIAIRPSVLILFFHYELQYMEQVVHMRLHEVEAQDLQYQ